ncbi:MAG: GspH/FimT family pseudopilin [Methylococcaceae bacterium]|nr:GspH/FimT family pseudopilin [Methylococcaceae bacterium]
MAVSVQSNRGFTLVESIVTLSVVALLLTIGIPGFRELISDNRMITQYNDFVSALNSTRSEAIKRGLGVTICKRNAAGSACNNRGNWEDGWIIFTDPDRDGAVDANANESILRIHEPLTGNNTLRASPTRNRITYNGQGFARGFADTFKLCDNRGAANAKGLVISNNGRTRRAIDTNADGVVDNGSGTSITCP